MTQCLVYMTAASEDEARSIGRTLVEERLAACTNILRGMTSLYWWEGKVEESSETIVIAKTRRNLVDELTRRVKALHGYSCPCIVAVDIVGGNPDFLAWIDAETGA